jgi:sterol desaturase/sphingolipid hydroxylase (fatty acid hydroxylase superfamily)
LRCEQRHSLYQIHYNSVNKLTTWHFKMTLDYWIYAASYLSLFSFLIFERYHQQHTVTLTKRDGLYLILEILAKLIGLTLSLYAMLWFVNIVAPYEIVSIANLSVPLFVSATIAFLLVDFFHYLSHRLHHQIPVLWRFHRLHHTDKKVNAMTTVLHHPFEIISSFIVNISCYVLFDIPVIIILVHALIAGLHSPFTHTSMTLSERWNRFLSYFIITPNYHRVHHSLDMKEGNSNFGIIFPFWDKLLGSYRSKDNAALRKTKFGISTNQSPKSLTLKELIVNPLR